MNAISSKIEAWNLQLRAIAYVRRSTPCQVQTNPKSTRWQYQLAEQARQMGWAAPQVEIIAEDLGLYGASRQAPTPFSAWSPQSAWARSASR
ncbi:MAG: hypothetical protein IRY87_04360 [Acetobacteraceae bacterium]|nr:hypothetical protein [Acetobacteraceae bacterium]